MASLFDLNKDGKVDENDAYLALEQAEKFYKVVEAKLPLYRPQINIALGCGTLLYSRSFSYTIIFSQAFKMSGWPVVKDGAEKLAIQYKAAREEARRQAPNLQEAKAIVSNYREEMAKLKSALKAAEEAQNEGEATALAGQVSSLNQQYQAASRALSSLSAIAAAVDPYKVGEIIGGMWSGVAACVAAAVSPSAQCLASGVLVGEKLAAFLMAVKRRLLPPKEGEEGREKWAQFYVEAACKGCGVLAAFYAQRLVNAYQGCVLGAAILVEAAEEGMALKGGTGLGEEGKAAAVLALGAGGFAWQLLSSGTPPGLVRPLLCLPLALEGVLKAFASRRMWEQAW
mmetsp:Transcript_12868/g.30635  ORF Transcript_12868/g.30635 Transcript_12868/m.30635 type:complete len:342 (-) Transcript_12868:306-1331(-)